MAIVMRMTWRGVTPQQFDEVHQLCALAQGDSRESVRDDDGTWLWTATWPDKDAAERFVCQELLPAVSMVRLRGGPDITFEQAPDLPAQRVDRFLWLPGEMPDRVTGPRPRPADH